MNLEFTETFEDVRGKIMVFKYGDVEFRVVEIKKGFSRGGHYHPYPSEHYIISGKIEYREQEMDSQNERVKTIGATDVVKIPPNVPHLFTALENSIFFELSTQKFEANYYPKYRKIVEEKIQNYRKQD